MLKFLKVLPVSTLLVIGAGATDFLSKATGGALSDNSMGIKRLNNTEMNQVFGGYMVATGIVNKNFAIAVAVPHDAFELGAYRNPNTGKLDYLYSDATSGICDSGVSKCYTNDKTFQHSQRSKNRLLEYTQLLGPYTLADGYLLAYTVKREVKTDSFGNRIPYFTYGAAAYHAKNGSVHPISSSFSFENTIIKELRKATKDRLESDINNLGW